MITLVIVLVTVYAIGRAVLALIEFFEGDDK